MDNDEQQQHGDEWARASDLAAVHSSLGEVEAKTAAVAQRQADTEAGVLAAEKLANDAAAGVASLNSAVAEMAAEIATLKGAELAPPRTVLDTALLESHADRLESHADRITELCGVVANLGRIIKKQFPHEV